MKYSLLILTFISFIGIAFAQESQTFVTQDSISNGSLSVTMNEKIDALLEEKENKCATIKLTSNSYTPSSNTTKRNPSSYGGNLGTTPSTNVKNPFGKEIDNCKLFPKMDGYKIQILYTKSSEEVNKVRAEFARSFPGLSSESSYLRPDFKVRAGEYLTREAASRDLKNIKRKFPTAIIVRSTVYCKRAKR